MKTLISRRQVLRGLKQVLQFLAVKTVVPMFLTSCKPKNEDSSYAINNKFSSVNNRATCPEKDHLSEQEKSIRLSLKYVDQTPIPHRTCDNCKLMTWAEESICGGCKVVPGPIHPKGYCVAWIPRM